MSAFMILVKPPETRNRYRRTMTFFKSKKAIEQRIENQKDVILLLLKCFFCFFVVVISFLRVFSFFCVHNTHTDTHGDGEEREGTRRDGAPEGV